MILLRATGLVGARGGRMLFGPIDLDLGPGAALVVAGPNGAGKSTLLRILAGLLPAAGGTVQARATFRYLGHHDAVKPALSVGENLRFWQRFLGTAGAEAGLAAVGLAGLADMPARYLSAGQRRRLALARTLDPNAALWLLDEPTNGLDAAAVTALEATVAGHRARGGAAVVVSHAELRLPDAARLELAPR